MTEPLRAHNASRVSDCPGSLRLQYAGETGRDNPSMAFGREMHSLVDDVVSNHITLEEIKNEEHREWVRRCVDFILKNIDAEESSTIRDILDRGEVWAERPLFVLGEHGEHVASGRADSILFRDDGKTAVVPDWKFYRFPLDFQEHQMQLLIYCVAVLQEWEEVEVVQGILYLPIHDHVHNLDLSRDLLPESLRQLTRIWREANGKDPPLRAGAWCARCPCLSRCPVALDSVEKIDGEVNLAKYLEMPELPSIQAMKTGILKKIYRLSPARFRRLVELFPLLAPLQDAIRAKLRADLKQDPTSHSAWELTERRGQSSASPEALRTVAGDFDIAADEFDESCMRVSVAAFRKLLAKKLKEVNPDVSMKEIEKQVMKELEPIVTFETQEVLQKRRR